VQSYSTNNTYIWTPTAAGSYRVAVYVKDVNSANSVDDYRVIPYTVTAGTPTQPTKLNSLDIDKVSPQATGTSITFTANGSGGTQRLYQFCLDDGSGFRVVQSYSTKKKYKWKPTAAGS
jgi:hypothetical protein